MTHMPQEEFFQKNHYSIFDAPLGPFHCEKSKKKIFTASESRVLTAHHFWAQNGAFALKRNFLGKTIDLT